jgi:hypothetical protein
MMQIMGENTHYSISNLTTIMQKKFNSQILASVTPLTDYEQTQITGGVNIACGCGDEKRKSVKVKKTPVVKSKLMAGLEICDHEDILTEEKLIPIIALKSIKAFN